MAIKSKTDAQNALREAWDCPFQTQNLEQVPSLEKLGTLLTKMRVDVYNYHVGEHHNHFSNWVRDVFGDEKLANDIFSVPKKEAASAVKVRVKWLHKKAK